MTDALAQKLPNFLHIADRQELWLPARQLNLYRLQSSNFREPQTPPSRPFIRLRLLRRPQRLRSPALHQRNFRALCCPRKPGKVSHRKMPKTSGQDGAENCRLPVRVYQAAARVPHAGLGALLGPTAEDLDTTTAHRHHRHQNSRGDRVCAERDGSGDALGFQGFGRFQPPRRLGNYFQVALAYVKQSWPSRALLVFDGRLRQAGFFVVGPSISQLRA